jgi:hypothetical protein
MRKNKGKIVIGVLAAVVAAGVLVTLMMLSPGVAVAGVGNDTPSGPHYNLNLIGMDKGKNDNIGCGEGHRIFVQLGKDERATTRILLQEGEFGVIDCDGTDGTASFQLPNPDPCNSGTTEYSVYLRLRGKPGGDIIMDTCATDPLTGEEICSDYKVVKVRETGHGKNKFENVSRELLYIYAWVCTDYNDTSGECENYEYMRVPLFSDILEDYLWQYDNNGVRLAQLRFYPGVSTTVPDPDPCAPGASPKP